MYNASAEAKHFFNNLGKHVMCPISRNNAAYAKVS